MDHKRQRGSYSVENVRGEESDILLRLPQGVLAKILSLLPTKDAVRTCILSKKWEYKWTCIYNLSFEDKYLLFAKRTKKEYFTNFVERVLTHCDTSSKLDKFTLKLTQNYGPRVSTWISAAVQRNVHSIELFTSNIPLPRCFYNHSSLRELKVQAPFTFEARPYGFFNSLKVLKLCRVTIDNPNGIAANGGNGRLSFPVLEVFQVEYCKWKNFAVVNVEAPLLVDFMMGFSMVYVLGFKYFRCEFRVIAPNLKNFKYLAGEVKEIFHLNGHVTKATVDQPLKANSQELSAQATNIITQLPRVECLRLSLDVLAHLAIAQRLDELPTMGMLIDLNVNSDVLPMSGVLILRFLHKTPNVNTLTLEMKGRKWVAEKYDEVTVPSCVIDHLMKVRFEYSNTYKFSPYDYRLMQYFVRSSTSLASIEINANGNKTVPKDTLKSMLLNTNPRASVGTQDVKVK